MAKKFLEASEINIKELLKHFKQPLKANKEIDKFVIDEALDYSRYIFCYDHEDRQKGYCSHCHHEVVVPEGTKYLEKIECPRCHSKVVVWHTWRRSPAKIFDTGYFHYFEKSKINPKAITCRGFLVIRSYDDFKKPVNKYDVSSFYLFDESSQNYMVKREYSWWTKEFHMAYPKTIQTCANLINNGWVKCWCVSKDSLKKAVEGTKFKYSLWEKYEDYLNDGYVKWLAAYNQYPSIEYIIKLGLKRLIEDRLTGCETLSALKLSGTNINQVLKMNVTKNDVQSFMKMGSKICYSVLRLMQIARKKGETVTAEDCYKVVNFSPSWSYLNTFTEYASIAQILNYAERIQTEDEMLRAGHTRYYVTCSTWYDYINDCVKLKYDLKDKTILFPRDLYKAHQATIEKVQYETNKDLNAKIKRRFNTLKKSLCLENDELIIRLAASSQEVIHEGSALHHCVGGYVKKYANGDTNILVLRKKEKPETPFYTIEVAPEFGNKKNKLRFVQIRGLNNCDPTKEIKPFVDEYKQKIQQMAGGM